MDLKRLDRYLLSKTGASFDYPFDETTKVYRIANKIFALLDDTKKPISINLKCDPIYALELRSLFSYIESGYHMNKKHWNTFTIVNHADEGLLRELIDHSYELVFASLSKKLREEIKLKG
ncbi:MAG: MmcQ/YjbR family DNA-binding protein [Campylobacterales bacterium]|nr:MmcQ/YjbR family DNA-binding protein [Campylobacterales bacterium]